MMMPIISPSRRFTAGALFALAVLIFGLVPALRVRGLVRVYQGRSGFSHQFTGPLG